MSRHADWWVVLALLVVALILLAPIVAQAGGLIYPPRGEFSDLTITHWPNIAFAVDSLRTTAHLPLWRSTIMSGTPFAANPLSGLFYFPHVIFLMLPLAVGFNVLFVIHVWLAGCGAYALLRAWQVERWAALIGALIWMATPRLFAHLGAGHVGMVEAVAWMPWSVLAARHMLESRRALSGVWLGAVWAIQFLADPRISFYTVALTVIYILTDVIFAKTPSRISSLSFCLRALGVNLLLPVLAFAVLSAVLALPFAEFIEQSNRGALTLSEAGEWSLPLHHLVGLVLADWGGFHEWMVYVGILPLLLAAISVCDACCAIRDRAARFVHHVWLVTCLVIAALFALGTNGPVFPILFRILPGLSLLRVPPRVWFIVAFAAATLSAFGVEAMLRTTRKPRAWVTLVGVALAAFALMFGLGGVLVLRDSPQAASARAALLHFALVVPASIAVVLLRAHSRLSANVFAATSAAVILATLLPVDQSLYRVVPEAQAFADHADVAAWLAAQRAQDGPFRVYSPSYSLPQHVAQRAGLELADGVDPLQIASYARFMEKAAGARATGYSVTIPAFPVNADVRTALRDARPDLQRLGRLNVRYIVSEFPMNVQGLDERARLGETFIYENSSATPRAFLQDGSAAHIETLTPGRILVEAEGPGVLTLSQVNYPGWRASVDGHAAPIETVDSVLMSVRLDAGRHVIKFVFEPWAVKAGVIVSVVGWGMLVAGWLVARLVGRGWKHATR